MRHVLSTVASLSVLALGALLAGVVPARAAGEASAARDTQGDLAAPKLNGSGARDAVQIEAGTSGAVASVKASARVNNASGAFQTISLLAAAPVGKDGGDTTLASRGGLAAGTTVSLGVSSVSLSGARTPGSDLIDKECGPGRAALWASLPAHQGESLVCDIGSFSELAAKGLISAADYRRFRSAFFGPDATVQAWGLTLLGGYQDHSFYDPVTLAKSQRRGSLRALALSYAVMPVDASRLLAARLGVQSHQKDAPATTACLPAPQANGLLTCASGSIGAPASSRTQVLDLEYRQRVSERFAFSVQLSRDIKVKVSSVSVPLYVLGNADGLTGGVSLGWATDDKKLAVGVFVGQAFSTQP